MRKEHVLIIRFSALGDVAMTVPVVKALANQYPDVRFTMLSRRFARAFFEDLAPNVSFMEADLSKEYHGVKGLNALYRRLTAKHFTAVADLHNVLRSDFLRLRFNLSHVRVEHIDKHRKGKRRLTSKKNKLLERQPTAFENYCEVFERLGYPVKLDSREYEGARVRECDNSNENQARGAEGNLLSLTPTIGIAPFAAHRGKIYPTEQMEQVVSQLCETHPDCRILLFGGGEKEMEVFNRWCQRYPQCINASQQASSLREELDLMRQLDVMISMDSANMHLASLVGTPVVSVWGATHPFAGFMGFGQKEEDAVQLDMPCRPCSIYGNKPCHRGDYACLRDIAPARIINKVEQVLGTVRNRPV